MALSGCQKAFYGIVLLLTILLAGLLIATAVKGYHYYNEDSNFRNSNEFGFGQYTQRFLQQNVQTIINNTTTVLPNGTTVITNGTNTLFIEPTTTFINQNPNVVIPNVITPSLINPNLINPNVVRPNVVVPNVVNPNVINTNPNVVYTNQANPTVISTNPNVVYTNQANPTVIYNNPSVANNVNLANTGYYLPNGTFVGYTQSQLRNVKCRSGQGVSVFGDQNYASKQYRHFMAFVIAAAILLAIIAFILLIAVCTDCLSSKARIILTVLGIILLFALGVVLAIKASQTNLQRERLYDNLGCPESENLDVFYKLLIAAAVISFVLGLLWLAFLGHGLLGDTHDATHVVSTNPNYHYDAPRSVVRSNQVLYASPPATNTHYVHNPAPLNTYSTNHQVPVTTTYTTTTKEIPVTTTTVHHPTTTSYQVPQSAERINAYY